MRIGVVLISIRIRIGISMEIRIRIRIWIKIIADSLTERCTIRDIGMKNHEQV
jgi:hypothetical protein